MAQRLRDAVETFASDTTAAAAYVGDVEGWLTPWMATPHGDDRPVGSDTIHASIAHGIEYDDAVFTPSAQKNRASRPTPGVRTELQASVPSMRPAATRSFHEEPPECSIVVNVPRRGTPTYPEWFTAAMGSEARRARRRCRSQRSSRQPAGPRRSRRRCPR